MDFAQAIANVSVAQWLGAFLCIPVGIVVFGTLYETFLKIYWKHKVKGEAAIAQCKHSARLAAEKIKREELAKESK